MSEASTTRRGPAAPRARTLAGLVDPRANTLNFVRLILAASVVFWHAYPVNGHPFPWPRAAQLFGSFGVDGFFAISGFLLAGSWLHKPHLGTYVKNRVLRIVPAFWVCLLVVGAVFAPLSLVIQGGDASAVLSGPHSAQQYLLQNAGLSIQFHDVAGTPRSVPFDEVWNGSLWTLRWEAMAYVGLAALGLLGLLRRRSVVPVLTGLVWLVGVGLAVGLVPDGYWVRNGARLALMFLAGMLLQMYGDRISARPRVAVACLGLLVVSPLLPDYRILAGLPLAYLVIWLGGAITDPRLRLKDRDISYGLYIYAFPVQQLLVLLGSATLPPPLAAVAALALTVPLAALSWVVVERPALHLKGRSLRGWRASGRRAEPSRAPAPTGREERAPGDGRALDGPYPVAADDTPDANRPVPAWFEPPEPAVDLDGGSPALPAAAPGS